MLYFVWSQELPGVVRIRRIRERRARIQPLTVVRHLALRVHPAEELPCPSRAMNDASIPLYTRVLSGAFVSTTDPPRSRPVDRVDVSVDGAPCAAVDRPRHARFATVTACRPPASHRSRIVRVDGIVVLPAIVAGRHRDAALISC